MRRVWIIVVCLALSSVAAAQDSSHKAEKAQTDAIVKQMSSELFSVVHHSSAGAVADNPREKAAGLSYVHMSDCENRWVALYHQPDDADYIYGFVYIDPQAGFTLHYFGRFTIDADGNYHAAPNPLPPDKASLKIRLDQNEIAAML